MELEAAEAIAQGLKFLGAGLAMTGAIGAGVGVAILVGGGNNFLYAVHFQTIQQFFTDSTFSNN